MQELVNKQRQHIEQLHIAALAAERAGDADKIAKTRKACDEASGALREYLALHPECDDGKLYLG